MALDTASSSAAAASLAPGFRFHPTDEELVRYYLRRKITGKPFRFDAISDIEIYKAEPWDLPGKSRLKTRDLEWYFFSALDKKYGNGSRTNRATDRGYWKTTGKDRPVYHRSQTVGMKKTLVYHCGRAPRGERTNWVMHEYRLIDEELERAGILQDAFVLCRIFRKSGSGPKNGEQYGAPLIEEEWDDDELVTVPKEDSKEEVPVVDDAYLDENDLEQIFGPDIPAEDAPIPLNFCYGDSNSVGGSTNFIEDAQNVSVVVNKNHEEREQPDDPNMFNLPVQYGMDSNLVKHEYIGEPSNVDYLLDQPYLDATPGFDDGAFLEANDLKPQAEIDPSGFRMLEEYLTYYDAEDENSQYMLGSEGVVLQPEPLAHKFVNEGTKAIQEPCDNDLASSSKQELSKLGSDIQYPFMKQASRFLGNIPAPPAFASEFPIKDAALYRNPASPSPSSVRVTAGMIQIREMSLSGSGVELSFGKQGHVNIVLSFGLSGDAGKASSTVSRGWFYFMFLWVLVLSISVKIGTFICAR